MKQYSLLIVKAKADFSNRGAKFLYAEHHVFAKCQSKAKGLAKDDRPSNIAKLTHQEHYEAHRLLCLIYPKHYGLAEAFTWVSNLGKAEPTDAETYAKAQTMANEASSIRVTETNIRLASEGKHASQTDKFKTNLSIRSSDYQNSKVAEKTHQWQTEAYSLAQSEMMSERGKLGLIWTQTEKGQQYMSTAMTELRKAKLTCKHCCVTYSLSNIKQWHNSNCKLLLSPGAFCNVSDAQHWLKCEICSSYFSTPMGLSVHKAKKHNLKGKQV